MVDKQLEAIFDIREMLAGEGIDGTEDITQADLTANAYTFSPAVDAIVVMNDGVTDITVTIGTKVYTVLVDESRKIEPVDGVTTVSFNAGATFRMVGKIKP